MSSIYTIELQRDHKLVKRAKFVVPSSAVKRMRAWITEGGHVIVLRDGKEISQQHLRDAAFTKEPA